MVGMRVILFSILCSGAEKKCTNEELKREQKKWLTHVGMILFCNFIPNYDDVLLKLEKSSLSYQFQNRISFVPRFIFEKKEREGELERNCHWLKNQVDYKHKPKERDIVRGGGGGRGYRRKIRKDDEDNNNNDINWNSFSQLRNKRILVVNSRKRRRNDADKEREDVAVLIVRIEVEIEKKLERERADEYED